MRTDPLKPRVEIGGRPPGPMAVKCPTCGELSLFEGVTIPRAEGAWYTMLATMSLRKIARATGISIAAISRASHDPRGWRALDGRSVIRFCRWVAGKEDPELSPGTEFVDELGDPPMS